MSHNFDSDGDFESQLEAKLEALKPEPLGVSSINFIKEWGGVPPC